LHSFFEREDAILYPSCFDANAGMFEALLGPEDAIISDALNHASIVDGIRLCKAQRYRYQNCDLADLEAQLQAADQAGARTKLIATDGVFSMDGKIAPLDKICDLAEKYGALVFVDECHATGILGQTGRGTLELFAVKDRVHIVNSTLGKALGGAAGGFTTSSSDIVTMLRQRSRPYLFSNTLPPAVVGSASAALDLLANDQGGLVQKLKDNTDFFRTKMAKIGFKVGGDNHPIVPIMLGDARLATAFAKDMVAKGIFVIGFSYPVVAKGKARIRAQVTAAHTKEQLQTAVDAFAEVGRLHKAIP